MECTPWTLWEWNVKMAEGKCWITSSTFAMCSIFVIILGKQWKVIYYRLFVLFRLLSQRILKNPKGRIPLPCTVFASLLLLAMFVPLRTCAAISLMVPKINIFEWRYVIHYYNGVLSQISIKNTAFTWRLGRIIIELDLA